MSVPTDASPSPDLARFARFRARAADLAAAIREAEQQLEQIEVARAKTLARIHELHGRAAELQVLAAEEFPNGAPAGAEEAAHGRA